MAKILSKNNGFTFVEILVAMILLAGVGIALISTMISGASIGKTNPKSYTAYNLTRETSDPLSNSVRDDSWDNPASPLSLGSHGSGSALDTTIDGVTYQRDYDVSDVAVEGQSAYRRAKIRVDYS